MKKDKRYVVYYVLHNDLGFDKKEKVLFTTNYYWLAKFYFKDRVCIFNDFVKDNVVECFVYDTKRLTTIMNCMYFCNSKKKLGV
ncbi:MAG: hypothetical protein IJO43_02240 [Bacilli bacterium]|nr:hypothetical protein [Bacilli bacterium]